MTRQQTYDKMSEKQLRRELESRDVDASGMKKEEMLDTLKNRDLAEA